MRFPNRHTLREGFWWLLSAVTLSASLSLLPQAAHAERVKDLASIAGVRSNHLVGYGLVVGLNGTGDQRTQAPFTEQSLRSMLTQLGVVVPPGIQLKPKNVAAVMLHANLPPFAKMGQKIDVTVSSVGDAKSLRGGSLLMAPLKGADGRVYAIAQGDLVVGGLSAEGADGSRITVNIPSVGRIPGGAMVERSIKTPFNEGDSITLNLHQSDFTTAQRLAEAINGSMGGGVAQALDAASVKVSAPVDANQRVSFVAMLEELELNPGEAPAKVVVNSRTGTVVINRQVRVTPAAVSHGNLMVTISENPQVSQPNSLAAGQTVVTPQSGVEITETGKHMFMFNPGATLDDIVKAVNEVGAAPSDLVAILEALREAGALHAELLVI